MYRCYSLKTAVLKTWFYPMENFPWTLQKDSQGSGCQKKSQLFVTKSKVPEINSESSQSQVFFFLISKHIIKISLRVYSVTCSVCLKASRLPLKAWWDLFLSYAQLTATQSIQQSYRRCKLSQKAGDTLE